MVVAQFIGFQFDASDRHVGEAFFPDDVIRLCKAWDFVVERIFRNVLQLLSDQSMDDIELVGNRHHLFDALVIAAIEETPCAISREASVC